MARAIDASHFGEIMEQWKKDCLECDDQHGADVILDVILQLDDMPTLTQPNEPLTLQELKAEAKRQGYKLIKAKRPRFEPCLCGHNVHQWVSGPKGWAVYCKHCGLYGPWAKKSHNAVIEAWNAMILEKRKEQENG